MRWSQVVFSGVGTGIALYGVTTALNFWVGPWARKRRQKLEEDQRMKAAILGVPAVTDRSGAIERPAQPGLVAMVADLQAEWPKNGTRAHVKLERTVKQAQKLEELIRNHMSDSANVHGAIWATILGEQK